MSSQDRTYNPFKNMTEEELIMGASPSANGSPHGMEMMRRQCEDIRALTAAITRLDEGSTSMNERMLALNKTMTALTVVAVLLTLVQVWIGVRGLR